MNDIGSRLTSPRSGLERSDFVPWPKATDLGDATDRQLSGSTPDVLPT